MKEMIDDRKNIFGGGWIGLDGRLLDGDARVAGDLPNLLIGKDGAGRFEVLTDPFTLRAGGLSVFDADRSAIVVHVGAADNMTHPTGNSGDRVACGITVAQ